MNIFQKIGFAKKLNDDANQLEDGVKTKNLTKIVTAVVAVATLILQSPQIEGAIGPYLTAHPHIGTVVGGVIAILTLFHDPKESNQ